MKTLRAPWWVAILLTAPVVMVQHVQAQILVTGDHCVDWQSNAAAFQPAYAAWQANRPACYSFSSTFRGFTFYPLTAEVHVVVNGTQVNATAGAMLQSMQDYYDMINRYCVQNCPGDNGAYTCHIVYNTTASGITYPAEIDIDINEVANDEEQRYSIGSVTQIDCNTLSAASLSAADLRGNAPPGGRDPAEICVDYEKVSKNLAAARKKWKNPSCYNFTLQRFGEIMPEASGPFQIAVRNNVVVNTGGGDINTTINGLFSLIQKSCVDKCPNGTDETAYQCNVDYASDGSPSYISIDYDQMIADEELYYQITNVIILNDCGGSSSTASENGAIKEGVCTDYQDVFKSWKAADDKWTDSSCYTYTAERQGRIDPSYRGPYVIKVKNGVPTILSGPSAGASEMKKTIQGWLDTIYTKCLKGCPVNSKADAAYECSIDYDSTYGYPSRMTFDYSSAIADEEDYFALYNYSVCSSSSNIVDPSSDLDTGSGSVKCVNYKAVASNLTAARARWTNPACYSFFLQEQGFLPSDYRTPRNITVRNDKVVNKGGALRNTTINEIFDLIYDTCVAGCDKGKGKAHECQIRYDKTLGYPTSIYIDYDERAADEETALSLMNLTIAKTCSSTSSGGTSSLSSSKCIGYETVKKRLTAARKKWAKPACYNYKIQQKLGTQSRSKRYLIKVRNNVVVDNGGSKINKTLDDYLNMINDVCVADCPKATKKTTAQKCTVTFSWSLGYPRSIVLDYNTSSAKSKNVYAISGFNTVKCPTTTTSASKESVVSKDEVPASSSSSPLPFNPWTMTTAYSLVMTACAMVMALLH